MWCSSSADPKSGNARSISLSETTSGKTEVLKAGEQIVTKNIFLKLIVTYELSESAVEFIEVWFTLFSVVTSTPWIITSFVISFQWN